jgi:hypothetical protein
VKCVIQRPAQKIKELNIHSAVSCTKLILRIYEDRRICLNKNFIYILLMMILDIKLLKLIILENASVERFDDENPTQNFFINYNCSCSPVSVSVL